MISSWATSHVILRRTNSSGTVSPSSGSDVTLHPNYPIYLLPCSSRSKLWASEGLSGAVRNVLLWCCLQIAVSLYYLIILVISYQDWLGLNPVSLLEVSGVKPDLNSLLYLAVYLKVSMRVGNECYVHRNSPVPLGICANIWPQMGVAWNVLHLQICDGYNVYKSYIVNPFRTNPECVFPVIFYLHTNLE